jgi:sugar lactone lactonase YvrE
MIFQILFYLCLIAIAAGCVVAAYIVKRHPLKPFARNLLITLIILEIITAAFHLYAISNRGAAFWDWFFDLQYELNLGSIFSALQLMVVAIVAFINVFVVANQKLWKRLYWLLLAGVFVFLSIDEFYAIHETLGDGRTVSEFWRIPYAIVGSLVALTSVAAWWFGFRRYLRLFILLGGGLIIMGVAGIAVEEFVMRGFVDENPAMEWLYVFEEVFEMVGATIILTGFLSYTQEKLEGRRWVAAKRIIVVGAVGWLVWLLFVLLFQAGIEARYVAHPLDVHYENGLSLVGYEITPDTVQPGSEVAVTLYWRANQPLTENYSISLHALSHPDIASFAQSDDLHLGPIPSTAWFPGVTMKRTLYLVLPKDLPTPESYWLLMRVWFGPWPLGRPWQDTTGVPLTSSGGLATIANDGLILDHLTALSPTVPPAPPTATTFNFPNEGFSLYGYDLPQEPVTLHRLPVAFWWRTSAAGQRDLTQFLHLVPSGGGETIALDGKPFGDSFPTQDWAAGMDVRDAREVVLPDEVPPGTYDVFTGFYDPATGERAAIVGADGQPVPNNAIPLGSIEYAPAAASAADETAAGMVLADYCIGVADLDLLREDGQDVMVAMHKDTGEVMTLGRPGTTSVEGMTFSADGTTLYAVDDYETYGQFVAGVPHRGWLEPAASQLTPPGEPARSNVLPSDPLIDIDSLSIDRSTGELWGITQDSRLLFQIDPEAGVVLRDTFGDGNDFIQIAVAQLPGGEYIKIEDLAISDDGTFYVLATSEDFITMLATIDLNAVDPDTGIVEAQQVGSFIDSASGTTITDVEGLSFGMDGTLYAISTNNSNDPAYYDTVWRIDLDGVQATRVGQFSQQVDYVDIEALACGGAAN